MSLKTPAMSLGAAGMSLGAAGMSLGAAGMSLRARALLIRPANTQISNIRSTRSSTRHSNIYDLIPDGNFKYLAFCLWRIFSV